MTYFITGNLYLLIPLTYFTHPLIFLPSGNHAFVLCVCESDFTYMWNLKIKQMNKYNKIGSHFFWPRVLCQARYCFTYLFQFSLSPRPWYNSSPPSYRWGIKVFRGKITSQRTFSWWVPKPICFWLPDYKALDHPRPSWPRGQPFYCWFWHLSTPWLIFLQPEIKALDNTISKTHYTHPVI